MNTLSTFIRQHRDVIVKAWCARVVELPGAPRLTPSSLCGYMSEILERLGERQERGTEDTHRLEQLPDHHASLRFRQGYDFQQVITEYRLLREVLMDLYAQSGVIRVQSPAQIESLIAIHEGIDYAIARAGDQFAREQAHQRELFIDVLGHDLRDPLNAILFSARLLSDQGEEPDAETTARTAIRIATSAQRMERLIRQLLDFARSHSGGGFALTVAPFDARQLVVHAVQELQVSRPERIVQCLMHVAEGDFQVEWDGDRISEAVGNLVSNAFVHGTDPIIIDTTDHGDRISISVSNGGELPLGARPRLFEAFSGAAESKGGSHLGLGLYIVRQIARAHGGEVSAESGAGSTTIRLTLPRRALSTTPPQYV